jgi:predicted nucleic acid-binding protein
VILVDTSVWVDHLRFRDEALARELDYGRVLSHPYVIGELACGHLEPRREILDFLGNLPTAPTATYEEALGLLEEHSLIGRGIGFIDVHLLASAVLATPARLWTRDGRLAAIASRLELGRE